MRRIGIYSCQNDVSWNQLAVAVSAHHSVIKKRREQLITLVMRCSSRAIKQSHENMQNSPDTRHCGATFLFQDKTKGRVCSATHD